MKYICELCGTVYDEQLGDVKAGVLPGTAFCDLPEDYECSGCGFKKEAFNPVRPKFAEPSVNRSNGEGS